MPIKEFKSISAVTAWLLGDSFTYPKKVTKVEGRNGIIVFRLSKSASVNYPALKRRLRNRAMKDALFSVLRDSGVDAASTFYNMKKGNLFGALKSGASLFKGLWTLPDESEWEERLRRSDPELYEVHELEEAFRKLALISYRHVNDVVRHDQRGPVYGGSAYDGERQIFYLKLT